MENLTKHYAQYIDKLRKKQGYTSVSFAEGICSIRQYQRYLSGESAIPYETLKAFCEKLMMTLDTFFLALSAEEDKDYPIISKLHTLCSKGDFEGILHFCKKHHIHELKKTQNQKYYEYCLQKAMFRTGQTNKYLTLKKYSELIDYPNCLSKKMYDFLDVRCLCSIAELEIVHNRSDALERLHDILLSKHLLANDYNMKQILPPSYANTALFLSRLNRFEESLVIAKRGIKHSTQCHDMSSMGHLLYIKAFAELSLNKNNEANLSAARCIAFAIATDNKHQIKTFYSTLKRDFGFDLFEVFFKNKNELLYLE